MVRGQLWSEGKKEMERERASRLCSERCDSIIIKWYIFALDCLFIFALLRLQQRKIEMEMDGGEKWQSICRTTPTHLQSNKNINKTAVNDTHMILGD